ncbi:hypothetical protein BaRGS_00004938 [Batillaria attramentaria]|uniref:Uncharacterized protein n=1 Tax=Batillaria attramentaria TaxID=370345 RepID=A0ABD0LWC5_9CAEN
MYVCSSVRLTGRGQLCSETDTQENVVLTEMRLKSSQAAWTAGTQALFFWIEGTAASDSSVELYRKILHLLPILLHVHTVCNHTPCIHMTGNQLSAVC